MVSVRSEFLAGIGVTLLLLTSLTGENPLIWLTGYEIYAWIGPISYEILALIGYLLLGSAYLVSGWIRQTLILKVLSFLIIGFGVIDFISSQWIRIEIYPAEHFSFGLVYYLSYFFFIGAIISWGLLFGTYMIRKEKPIKAFNLATVILGFGTAMMMGLDIIFYLLTVSYYANSLFRIIEFNLALAFSVMVLIWFIKGGMANGKGGDPELVE